jgi:MYXO-CTERM domain-containing protein
MNSMRRGAFILMSAALFLCVLGWAPTAGATSCSAGPLSGVIGTTCTIGDLQITFEDFFSDGLNSDAGSSTNTLLAGLPITDFTFTPTSDGFSIGFTGTSPVTVNSPDSEADGSYVTDEAGLNFQATVADGLITGMGISGGTLNTTSTDSSDQLYIADYLDQICTDFTDTNCAGAVAGSVNGTGIPPESMNTNLTPFSTGQDGVAEIFDLQADSTGSTPGGSASWDGTTPTTFTFDTAVTPTPEPGSASLFGVGLLGLLGMAFWQRRRSAQAHCR